jgi:hypothetical protein
MFYEYDARDRSIVRKRPMPTDQDLPKKDQPASAELETKSEELKPEDAEKVAGGGSHTPHLGT